MAIVARGAGRPLRSARPARAVAPTLRVERDLWAAGHEVVVGVDEVGRGSWAGPLMVGAAVLPPDRRVYGVRDSKMLSEAERERLFDRVASWCRAWAVGAASQEECDRLGMADAQRLAARRAVEGLGLSPDQVLVDGNWDFVGMGCTRRIVKGDATCLSISAASILAKVTRDRLMRGEAAHYPGYDFEYNKGYPCPRHKMALQAYGPTAIHRRSWIFMENLSYGVAGSRRLLRPGQEQLALTAATG
ncbi:ribonuclease HII [Acidiferrimicrobium sp. IK]|uniref:ribonuclease HII n=1 Tax=Acidiferrimicrobium sp. IK TaxID=2871700 RepID=UPI0021CB07E9|nr:ribonuclease HII [Acidiferrimicrobium sp. IK]MCU4184396.1 ribonuclease HII [Acidiferrimicrobium sp. IK]